VKARIIDAEHSVGKMLSDAVFSESGQRLFAKGHRIEVNDVLRLYSQGITEVSIAELEEGEIDENEAVMRLAGEIGSGSIEARLGGGGKLNLFATEPSCVLVDDQLLKQVNYLGSVAVATLPNFSYVEAGGRIGAVKSTPLAVDKSQLDPVISILKEKGPVLQARPIRTPSVGILYTDPVSGEKARFQFENIMRRRLDRMGIHSAYVLVSIEEETAVARCLRQLLLAKPSSILIASTTAPAGIEDVVGRAMMRVGCRIERTLAPVDPGALFLLCYKDDVPIVLAVGCYRSAKPNVLDLLLPPMLARHRVSSWDVARLGHGGLLA
jgi:molybdenum cofactor cytidylyltransferase